MMIHSPVPLVLLWGNDGIMLYNQPYAGFAGNRHPSLLGSKVLEGWPEAADLNAKVMATGMAGGTLEYKDLELALNRRGQPEPGWMDLFYSPVIDESGKPGGVIAVVVETTTRVLAERSAVAQREQLAQLFQNAPSFMCHMEGPDHVFAFTNAAYQQLIAHRDVIGKTIREALPEIAGQGFYELLDQVYATGESYRGSAVPVTLQRMQGAAPEERLLDFIYQPVRDTAGKITGIFTEGVDVIESRLAEIAARDTAARLQIALSAANSVGTWDWDVQADKVVADAGFATLYGVDPEHAKAGAPIAEFFSGIHPDDAAALQVAVAQSLASSEPFTAEYRLPQPDGANKWVLAQGRSTLGANGKPARFSGISFDITERKNAEIRREALVRLTDTIRDIDDANDLTFAASTILGETLQVSRVSYGTIDHDAETLTVEKDWLAPGVETLAGTLNLRAYGSFIDSLKAGEFIAISDVDKDPRTVSAAAALKGRGAAAFVNVPVLEKGKLAAVLFLNNAQPRNWSKADLLLVQEVAERTRTATERILGSQALRDSEAQFRTMALAMPNHVWTAGPDGLLDFLNDRTYDYAGAVPGTLLGHGWATIVHPHDIDAAGQSWSAALAAGTPYEAEFRLRRGDGVWRWHIARAAPIRDAAGTVTRWIGTNTDIQDQKEVAATLADLNATLEQRVQDRTGQLQQAEEALRQAQKMEAVGQLTGGIAHDFNNLLQGITGALDRVQHRISEGRVGDVDRFLKAALDSANRAAALTHRLLAFSRRQTLDPRPTDPNRMIGGMEDLIRRTMGPNVQIEVVGAAGVWPVRVDPSQLENSLLNLCINARDAMPEGGKLTIETANKWLDERAAKGRELPPGQYVSLCVTDTGTGMTPEVIERAFDPFYTTKPIGQGTGLGLSMIYGFVRQSGGQVRIYSEIGKGTTMCLYFPRHIGEADADNTEISETTERGFGETVLVVDDEPTVRMLIAEVLSENFYNIIEAGDGPSALKILESNRRIDMMITDVGLPGGMNGRQVADAARVVRKNLKVLFITGYAENAAIANGHLEPGMEILAKPFAMSTLANKVREMIET
jgi:PAS domain S-box-containing protein